jgi:hypothetical protein
MVALSVTGASTCMQRDRWCLNHSCRLWASFSVVRDLDEEQRRKPRRDRISVSLMCELLDTKTSLMVVVDASDDLDQLRIILHTCIWASLRK